MPQDTYPVERAIKLVEKRAEELEGRRKRMDADYRMQRSDAYNTNRNIDGNEAGTDYKSFTSTIAGAFVKKVVAVLAGAKLNIRVPYGLAQQEQRQLYDMKERFAYGVLEAANDALVNMVKLTIDEQSSWYAPNRGWLVGLWLFANKDGQTTDVMIHPWDPLNVTWRVGGGGLSWACNKVRMRLGDIREEWPDTSATIPGDVDEEHDVFDFWTHTNNAVFIDTNVMLKSWTPHGSPRHPVVIVPVASQPSIWSDAIDNTEDDYGESILATNRNLYDHVSEVMSITLDLLERARDPSSIVYTDEEDTELEEDPNREGGVHYLAREDKFQQLVPPQTTKDAIQLMQMTMGMIQRGDLPFSTYGDINFALSGYAITQLNQQMLTVIGPQTRAISRWLKQGLDLLIDQYVSGQFNPMEIRGAGNNKDYMQVTIPPQALANLPPFDVKILAELPQDDVAKLTAAQTARGFLPDRWLRDEYMQIPDGDLVDQQLKAERAEQANPRAQNLVLAQAALKDGRPDIAQVYIDEMALDQIKLILQRMFLMSGAGLGQPGGDGDGGGGENTPRTPGIPGGVVPGIVLRGGQQPTPNTPTGQEGQFGLPRQR